MVFGSTFYKELFTECVVTIRLFSQNWKLLEGPSLLHLASIIPEPNPVLRLSALVEISCSPSGSQLEAV